MASDGEALLSHACGFRYDTDLVTRRSFSWCFRRGGGSRPPKASMDHVSGGSPSTYSGPGRARLTAVAVLAVVVSVLLLVSALTMSSRAFAAIVGTVGLGTADDYSVLGGSAVTNTGPSVLSDDLGVSPGSAITGFPPGLVLGAIHANDAVAAQAQSDVVVAYNDAAGRPSNGAISADLGGSTLIGGVYTASSSAPESISPRP